MSDENPYAPPEANIEVEVPASSELAGRWARFGGSFIDSLIGSLIVFPTIFWLGFWERMATEQQTISDNVVIAVLWLGSFVVINGYLLATRGQTVGKKLVGTRIVSITDGRILPFWKVFVVRYIPFYLLAYIPVIGAILSMINVLFIFREDRRCGHDLLAGTRVVKAD